MRRVYWVVVFVAVLGAGLLGYMYWSYWKAQLTDIHHGSPEKVAVLEVAMDDPDSFTLSVKVKSLWSETSVFNGAIIINQDEDNVGFIPEQVISELPANSEKIITLNFNTTLPSGEYRVILVTERGGAFFSPSFTKP